MLTISHYFKITLVVSQSFANKSDNSRDTIRLIIPKSTNHPTNKKAPVKRLFEKPRYLAGLI